MQRKNIAVIFGGVSTEYEVSLISATTIIKNLDRKKYHVRMIGITQNGKMYKYTGDVKKIKTGEWETSKNLAPCVISPDRKRGGLIILSNNGFDIQTIDCVIPCLHGKNGEDGTIQGLLQLANIPFVGCDTLSSAVCMDKEMTHIVLDSVGIKTAPYIALKKTQVTRENIELAEGKLGYPMFVKPANAGSSFGVSKATDNTELKIAIELAFKHDKKILLEKAITGREIECAVLGENENPQASLPGEIVSCNEFYDFEAKYKAPDSKLTIPASLDEKTTARLRETAKKAFSKLGCEGLSRVDFFVTPENDLVINEINTFPGFTSISMYPKMWEKTGLTIQKLLEELINLAIKRRG